MEEDEFKELQDSSAWEEAGEIRPPVTESRVMVSVAFSRNDFQQVSDYAKQHGGMKTLEFIRKAALDAASSDSHASPQTTPPRTQDQ